jgi:deoxyribodipyrimidine photo-lyase
MVCVTLQVVWFKRDLRVFDHEALSRACLAGPVLCLYVIEPGYWQLGDTSRRQWLFVRESLLDLAEQLHSLGAHLVVRQGQVTEVLQHIRQAHGPFELHSHQETGNAWTYERDKAVANWCRVQTCPWHEFAQNAVTRPVAKRQLAFKDHRDAWAARPLFSVPSQATFAADVQGLPPEQWPLDMGSDLVSCPGRQTGGRAHGLALLGSFMGRRGQAYRGAISSPLTAESACSRLSPYIAQGCLSLREISQRASQTEAQARHASWSRSLEAFASRLAWHCHFIQKLETLPQMEHTPVWPAAARLHRPFDAAKFNAWKTGTTGWPLVDASMRYLQHHGWINFRMRAMLVSSATYSLSLPWQPVAQWLAQLFVDYEPGIHYPQVQMQSGANGGTVLRMYNPVTQATELDPEGRFVRQWVPELRQVSATWIFEPWKMTPVLRQHVGWTPEAGYPCPLVDFVAVHRAAKAEMTALRAGFDLESAALATGDSGSQKRPSSPASRSGAERPQRAPTPAASEQQFDLF